MLIEQVGPQGPVNVTSVAIEALKGKGRAASAEAVAATAQNAAAKAKRLMIILQEFRVKRWRTIAVPGRG
jgi:hypothetical protein